VAEEELQALLYVARGYTMEVTGRKMRMDADAVKYRLRSVMIKLGTRSTPHSVVAAEGAGLISIPATTLSPEPCLGGKQLSILIHIGEGLSRGEIRKKLGFDEDAVKRLISALYLELEAKSRPHLIYRGIETGNIPVNRRSTP
jgi:DNA-binding CsgD family transcriptional regulator